MEQLWRCVARNLELEAIRDRLGSPQFCGPQSSPGRIDDSRHHASNRRWQLRGRPKWISLAQLQRDVASPDQDDKRRIASCILANAPRRWQVGVLGHESLKALDNFDVHTRR